MQDASSPGGAPIVGSLLDTDFYKFLMCQVVHRHHPDVEVTFELVNRSRSERLAERIAEADLRDQLDRTRALGFTADEVAALGALESGPGQALFSAEFLTALRQLRLPPYQLAIHDGQFVLTFTGPWPAVMLWEVPALAVLMELRSRAVEARLPAAVVAEARRSARARLVGKLARLAQLPGLALSDFGTRRRHSLAWQELAVLQARDVLGAAFTGTSNVLLAVRHGLVPIGTSAHELPMVYAALADGDTDLAASPYRVLADWEATYGAALRVMLPDTFGTAGFLARAPDWVTRWSGIRIDSGDPAAIADLAIGWWRQRGEDPAGKRVIFSDGLDVDEIETLHARYAGQVRAGFGWGTLLTNDFRGLAPGDGLAPFSLVCKAVAADGRPTVKLSDNPGKALGPAAEIARYHRVFAVGDQPDRPVVV
ncbi:MAG: nicotinate phosphoribosyltransferase [Planctomycetes bacterium]|nr:nicotinate phosphoribosyltransferase [Planctomycetota bacterium]